MGKAFKSVGKVGKAVVKGFGGSVIKSAVKGVKQVGKGLLSLPSLVGVGLGAVTDLVTGDTPQQQQQGGTTIIQQTAEQAKQRYALEEGKATEQGASEISDRLANRKKIKRLSTTSKGG